MILAAGAVQRPQPIESKAPSIARHFRTSAIQTPTAIIHTESTVTVTANGISSGRRNAGAASAASISATTTPAPAKARGMPPRTSAATDSVLTDAAMSRLTPSSSPMPPP